MKTHCIHYYFLQWRLQTEWLPKRFLLTLIVLIQWAYMFANTHTGCRMWAQNALKHFKTTWKLKIRFVKCLRLPLEISEDDTQLERKGWLSFCWFVTSRIRYHDFCLCCFVHVLIVDRGNKTLWMVVISYHTHTHSLKRFGDAKFFWRKYLKMLAQQLCLECCHLIGFHKMLSLAVDTDDYGPFYDEFAWCVCEKWVSKSKN